MMAIKLYCVFEKFPKDPQLDVNSYDGFPDIPLQEFALGFKSAF